MGELEFHQVKHHPLPPRTVVVDGGTRRQPHHLTVVVIILFQSCPNIPKAIQSHANAHLHLTWRLVAVERGSHNLTVLVVVGVPAKILHKQLHNHKVHSHTYKNTLTHTHTTTPRDGWWRQKMVEATTIRWWQWVSS